MCFWMDFARAPIHTVTLTNSWKKRNINVQNVIFNIKTNAYEFSCIFVLFPKYNFDSSIKTATNIDLNSNFSVTQVHSSDFTHFDVAKKFSKNHMHNDHNKLLVRVEQKHLQTQSPVLFSKRYFGWHSQAKVSVSSLKTHIAFDWQRRICPSTRQGFVQSDSDVAALLAVVVSCGQGLHSDSCCSWSIYVPLAHSTQCFVLSMKYPGLHNSGGKMNHSYFFSI